MCEKAKVEEQEREVEKKEEEEEEWKVRVKFVANKERTKVLFAEAGSDFVDILLNFLLLPLGKIVNVMKKSNGEGAPIIGSLSTLYNSIEKLDSIHFVTEDAKSLLLNPTSLDDDYDDGGGDDDGGGGGGDADADDDDGDDDDDDGDDDDCPQFDQIFTDTTASFVISDDMRVMLSVEGSVVSTLSSLGVAITDMEEAETLDMDLRYNQILKLLGVTLICRNPLTALLLPPNPGKRIRRVAEQENVTNKIGMKAISTNSKKMILKVMMQKSTNKLLFAQAQQDFISFLFGLLRIPLGKVEWYLHSNSGLRTIDNLHRSIPDFLYRNGVMAPRLKDLLFKPDLPSSGSSSNESSSRRHYTDYNFVNEYIPLNFDPCENQYHVRGARMYMVSDDLTVKPLSITSSISAIKEMKISLSDVEEVEMEVGFEEGLSIMRAALTSTTALTDGLLKPKLKKQAKR